MYFHIEDYFTMDPPGNFSKSEIKEFNKVREDLNSFKTVKEQVAYINSRRSSLANRKIDHMYYGIPINAELDKKRYSESSTSEEENKYWNGASKSASIKDAAKIQGKGTLGSLNFALISKVTAIVIVVILIINIIVYAIGAYDSVGKTPFDFCSDKEGGSSSGGPTNINFDSATKVKDGYKIPVDYMVAGAGYTGQGYAGPDDTRGIGVFVSEDFVFDGTDSFSKNNYAIASRWEYVSYSVRTNMWPGHARYGNGTPDGVDTSKPFKNLDSAQYSWTVKQKVLVHNPENGKSVVCIVGNGVNDANWGGSPLNGVAGLSYKAQEALGFSAGGLNGGDYPGNVRDQGTKLEMWWVDENTQPGPVGGLNSTGGGTTNGTQSEAGAGCGKAGSTLGGGNSSIADAAVSMAHESVAIATPNSSANNGNGTDLYVNIRQKVIPGDAWFQSCDRFVVSSVRWAGGDDDIPPGSTGVILDYLRKAKDKWEYIPAKGEQDLKPGDIIVKTGHIILYVGNEAVKKKFPNSTGVLAHASIGSASSPTQQQSVSDNRGGAIDNWYNMGLKEAGGAFEVYRNIKPQENSKYKDVRP